MRSRRNIRWLPALLLALTATPALAAWIKVGASGGSTFYLESSELRKVNGHVMIKVLRDHSVLRNDGAGPYLSSRDELEVDCAGQRLRRMYSSDHPLHMGEGKPVHTEHGPMSWNLAAPHTLSRRIVDVACAGP